MYKARMFILIGLIWLLTGCGSAAPPTATPVPPTGTPVPPTDTPVPPTATPVPPTATPIPPTATPAPKKLLIQATIPAPSLANNMLDEPAEGEVAIYLPPSYYETETAFPVIYYLAGYDEGVRESSYIVKAVADQLIEAGDSQEMIIALVSGQNLLNGSFYVNSPVSGNWEDYVVNDVVGYVEENFRAIPKAEARGIGGFSMGGFGALHLAMRHPDLFGAVYALSPGLFAPEGLSQSQMFADEGNIEAFLTFETELAALPAEEARAEFLERATQLTSDLRFTVAYGVAFAPAPDQHPPYIRYPYDELAGEPDQEIWDQWENGYGNLAEKVEMYKDNLLQLRGIVINYGTRDRYTWIPEGCDYFSQQLELAEIPHQLITFEGGHGEFKDQAEGVMLPFFSETLVASE